jgi:hypothetical protein
VKLFGLNFVFSSRIIIKTKPFFDAPTGPSISFVETHEKNSFGSISPSLFSDDTLEKKPFGLDCLF